LDTVAIVCLFGRKILIVLNEAIIKIVLINLDHLFFLFLAGLEDVRTLTHMIGAFKGPAIRVFGGMVDGDSATALLGDMI
jgi:hypothetical protein